MDGRHKEMKTISIHEYKTKYLDIKEKIPGEHHFVAVYLLPHFHKIPDYVNPDGTKSFCGDIGFCNNSKLFSIEVKIGKKSFTFSKNENNNWLVKKEEPLPNYLIALTLNYYFIIEWDIFSSIFENLKHPKIIVDGRKNSLSISEKELVSELQKLHKNTCFFNLSEKNIERNIETRFDELNEEIDDL